MSNSAAERRFPSVLSRADVPVDAGETATDFDSLFRTHYAGLTRIAYRVVGDAGWAEEIASEAFWKLHRTPPRDSQNIGGWLYRTALHLALDHLKKRKRRAHYESLAPVPHAVCTPEESFELRERQQRVREVLASLKPEQAAILVLRSEGHTLAEIAAVQGLHAPSMGTFLARADQAFRKEYEKRYGTL